MDKFWFDRIAVAFVVIFALIVVAASVLGLISLAMSLP